MENVKKNKTVDVKSKSKFRLYDSKLKIVVQGNTEKIPLSIWLQIHSPSMDSIKSGLLELKNHLKNHLIGLAASVCIGTECFHAGACSTNLCNTKENLLALNSAMRICDFKQTLLFITLFLALWW